MSFLRKLLAHLRKGTLFNRLINWRVFEEDRRWNKFMLSPDEFIKKRLRSGLAILLKKNELLSRSIYYDIFERDELEFLKTFLKKGDVFIDVGANVGLFTLWASWKVKKDGKVVSFEPSHDTFQLLSANVEINKLKNIFLIEKALSDKCEKREMKTSTGGLSAWNTFGIPSEAGDYHIREMETTTLDEVVVQLNLEKVDLIKIDVEGWELPVLKGGIIALRRYSPTLLIEFNDRNYRAAGFNCQELYDWLNDEGYVLAEFALGQKRLVPAPKRDFYNYTNLIACRDIGSINMKLQNR